MRGEREMPGGLKDDGGGSDVVDERAGDGIFLPRRSGGGSKDGSTLDKKALRMYFFKRAADVRSQPGGESAGRVRWASRYRRCSREKRPGGLDDDNSGSGVVEERFGYDIFLLRRSGGSPRTGWLWTRKR